MGRNTGAVNYAVGSASGNPINMYIHGGAVLSFFTFLFGLASTGNFDQAMGFLFDFYLAKLLPWPLDEAYLAQTLTEFFYSHAITIGVGIASASSRWWASY
ncbi:hypothetical protein SAMN04487967_1676 [Natronorubrum sediminis]|uniref:Uncharacterized protein n=1 Tax=Natronorubrum sediminis TaxID=640943 RepID=A0A1H6FX50_9EURY|nr:hypothetical protein [Natronorubrum sediminis]SEH14593.1 hypothetical protein SAMN04487967_1676 [Natronorubrum sediminis]